MKKVLILTHSEDPHALSVANYLTAKGVSFFTVETDKLISHYTFEFSSQDGIYRVSDSDRKIELTPDWVIWNRRVMDPDLPPDFPKELEDIVFTETERSWQGLLFTHSGRVVNRPQAEFVANNKMDQLLFSRAYGNGIDIPETLLTNNPDLLRRFYDEGEKICHKLQKIGLVKKNGNQQIVYTNLVTDRNIEHADLIRRNPSLFQKYIPKEYELRITALEEKVVGIAIHSQDSELSKIDFRKYDFENVRYEKVDLPDHVGKFCSDLIKHYGLSFGEIDMIYTPSGEYVFLELNPNGQWLWLELKSGYPLTKDVAENLLL